MLDKRPFLDFLIAQEMEDQDVSYWFDFKQQKFLHNIDTFYYSVKLCNDFTADTHDRSVLQFRTRLRMLQAKMSYNDSIPFYVPGIGNMNLLNLSYGKYYNVCLECPEYFHVFMASQVPPGAGGRESVTCEIIVQIRSYMLWMYGVHGAFERSLSYIQGIVDMFDLQIAYIQENRIDYCWHSNYLSNPEKFFDIENFYKMRVDRYKGANYHTAKVGSESYEIDYVSLGNRGGKCFIRIYLKSKEVVEQGYKAFFFKLWLFHGLISRYDLYCYEKAYVRRSWPYMTIARLLFYIEYGQSEPMKESCRRFAEQYEKSGKVTDVMIRLAGQLTPPVHLITNVEYQTMRKGTKSYVLLPVKDNSAHGAARRVYDYLDNRPLIVDYLTRDIFRLVEPAGDSNKSRRNDCGFWRALRRCRLVDSPRFPDDLHMVRDYNRERNEGAMRGRLLNSVVVYGFYDRGLNEDSVMKDCYNALLRMNDNDLMDALRYKRKKARQFNGNELPGITEPNMPQKYVLLDRESGVIYDDDSIDSLDIQDWS